MFLFSEFNFTWAIAVISILYDAHVLRQHVTSIKTLRLTLDQKPVRSTKSSSKCGKEEKYSYVLSSGNAIGLIAVKSSKSSWRKQGTWWESWEFWNLFQQYVLHRVSLWLMPKLMTSQSWDSLFIAFTSGLPWTFICLPMFTSLPLLFIASLQHRSGSPHRCPASH